MFGVYEQLTERIKTMAPTIPRLLEEILVRIETDHGKVFFFLKKIFLSYL